MPTLPTADRLQTAQIRARLDELGMSQEDLAKKMGVSAAAVSLILASKRCPTVRTFKRLCAALEIDPKEVW